MRTLILAVVTTTLTFGPVAADEPARTTTPRAPHRITFSAESLRDPKVAAEMHALEQRGWQCVPVTRREVDRAAKAVFNPGDVHCSKLEVSAAMPGTRELDDEQKRARIAKAQAGARVIASAVNMYAAHTASLPKTLTELTYRVQNTKGQVAGPFLHILPEPPSGWSPYAYTTKPEGVFTVTTKGDDTVVTVP